MSSDLSGGWTFSFMINLRIPHRKNSDQFGQFICVTSYWKISLSFLLIDLVIKSIEFVSNTNDAFKKNLNARLIASA